MLTLVALSEAKLSRQQIPLNRPLEPGTHKNQKHRPANRRVSLYRKLRTDDRRLAGSSLAKAEETGGNVTLPSFDDPSFSMIRAAQTTWPGKPAIRAAGSGASR